MTLDQLIAHLARIPDHTTSEGGNFLLWVRVKYLIMAADIDEELKLRARTAAASQANPSGWYHNCSGVGAALDVLTENQGDAA